MAEVIIDHHTHPVLRDGKRVLMLEAVNEALKTQGEKTVFTVPREVPDPQWSKRIDEIGCTIESCQKIEPSSWARSRLP